MGERHVRVKGPTLGTVVFILYETGQETRDEAGRANRALQQRLTQSYWSCLGLYPRGPRFFAALD